MPRPCGHKILVSLYKPPSQSKGGIILPDAEVKHEQRRVGVATVVALGPTCYRSKKEDMGDPWCVPGDKIYVSPHVGFRVYIKGVEDKLFKFIDDEDVIGIVEDSDETVETKLEVGI